MGVHGLLVSRCPDRSSRGRRHDRGRDGRVERVLREEWFKVGHNFSFVDSKVVVQQVKQLLFHQVDLGLREHLGVSTPVLVFGARIVEVLGSDNESSEEDPVSSARHALGDLGQSVSESLEVDECGEQSGDLHVGLFADNRDKSLERRESRSLGRAGALSGRGRWWGRREWDGSATSDDRGSSISEVV